MAGGTFTNIIWPDLSTVFTIDMAVGGSDNFTSWLSGYLSERSIDVDVYLEYICGIVSASGEEEEEDLISSLEEVLSGAVVSARSSYEIL